MRLILPASYTDVFEGYAIARVKVVQCFQKPAMHNKEYIFLGNLPCCRPYFIFDAPVEICKTTYTKTTIRSKQVDDGGIFDSSVELRLREHNFPHIRFERVFTVDTLTHIARYELCRKAKSSLFLQIQQAVLEEMISFIYDTSRVDMKLIEDVPLVNELLHEYTDFWRLPFTHEILRYYLTYKNKKSAKIFRTVSKLPYRHLVEISTLFREDPIRCCWQNSRSSLSDDDDNSPPSSSSNDDLLKYPLNYEAFSTLITLNSNLKEKYSALQHLAVRILDFFRRVVVGKQNATAMVFNMFKNKYMCTRRSLPEKEFKAEEAMFGDAMEYLCSTEVHQLMCISFRKLVYVTLPKFHKNAMHIAKNLEGLLRNGETERAESLLRNTDLVPCIPKQLTDEQSAAAHHMLNSPLTIILGPPGRGKTCLIEFAMALWKRVCVVSFVGTVVAGHRRRMNGRLECSNTAHHLYKSALASPEGAQWADAFKELVWDEFSNVDDSLFCKTLEPLKNLSRLVLVLDPYQIQPLGNGSPAMDLIDAFYQDCFTLTTNMRVNPRSRELADAILYIMHNEPERIQWSYDMQEKASMTLLDAPVESPPAPPAMAGGGVPQGFAPPFTGAGGASIIETLLRHILAHPDVYKVATVMDIQFIAFTNKLCRYINGVVETLLQKLGLCVLPHAREMVRVNGDLLAYPGCKICVVKENFDSVITKDGRSFDSARNGECGVVVSCLAYSGGTVIKWNTGGTTEKTMFLSKSEHVDPACVQLGHCITSNKAQALEYNTVVGVLDDGGAACEQWVYNSHLYVMSSRAKEAYFLLGKNAESRFRTICARREPRRPTILLPVLLPLLPRLAEETREELREQKTEYFYNQKTHHYDLDTNLNEPCVPALYKYKTKK